MADWGAKLQVIILAKFKSRFLRQFSGYKKVEQGLLHAYSQHTAPYPPPPITHTTCNLSRLTLSVTSQHSPAPPVLPVDVHVACAGAAARRLRRRPRPPAPPPPATSSTSARCSRCRGRRPSTAKPPVTTSAASGTLTYRTFPPTPR